MLSCVSRGFPGGSVVKNSPANAGDASLIPGSGRAPGEGNGNPLQYFLLGKSHGQRSLEDYSPCSCKRVGHDLGTKTTATILRWHFHESTQCHEIASVNVYAQGFPGDASVKEPTCKCRRCKRHWVPSWGQEDPPRGRTRKPTPIFLPGESHGQEPGGLQSIGLQRVGHDWSDLSCVHVYAHSDIHVLLNL